MKKFNLLIADRNPHIRNFLKREMQAEGYHVQLAINGREVLNLIFSPAPIDLMIIDVDLPGASELNLLKCLEDRIPRLLTIIHGFLPDLQEFPLVNSSVVFVQKQGNSIEKLKKMVYEMLLNSVPKNFKTSEDPQ